MQKVANQEQFLLDKHSSLAEGYDKMVDKRETVNKYLKMRKTLLTYAQGDVLEMGSGTGLNLPHYPEKGINKMIGIDWSVDMIEECLSKEESSRMTFKIGNCEKMPFEDESFDTVVDTFSL